jgi:hypothetical protein
LQLFEDARIRKVFGAQNDDVSRLFRILHNEEVRDIYESCRIVKLMLQWAGMWLV